MSSSCWVFFPPFLVTRAADGCQQIEDVLKEGQ